MMMMCCVCQQVVRRRQWCVGRSLWLKASQDQLSTIRGLLKHLLLTSPPATSLFDRMKTATCELFLKPRLHQDTCYREQVVSTCIHLSPSTFFLYQRLSPVCRPSVAGYKGIHVDRNYVASTVNMYPKRATCIRRHVSVDIYVFRYKLLVRNGFRAICGLGLIRVN